jgi:hypothetical protein
MQYNYLVKYCTNKGKPMNKQLLSSLMLALVVSLTPVAFFSNTALARAIENNESERETETPERNKPSTEKREVIKEKIETKKERFDANKLRVCEKRKERFKTMMQQVSDRGAKQLGVFKAVADKTNAFYSEKGYNVANYTTVSKEVDELYTQSLAAVNTTQEAKDSWSCDGNNPVGAMEAFRTAKAAEVATLKAYKDKVRQLILLVKQAGGKASTDASTEGGAQ